jgi:hypothetical protein
MRLGFVQPRARSLAADVDISTALTPHQMALVTDRIADSANFEQAGDDMLRNRAPGFENLAFFPNSPQFVFSDHVALSAPRSPWMQVCDQKRRKFVNLAVATTRSVSTIKRLPNDVLFHGGVWKLWEVHISDCVVLLFVASSCLIRW